MSSAADLQTHKFLISGRFMVIFRSPFRTNKLVYMFHGKGWFISVQGESDIAADWFIENPIQCLRWVATKIKEKSRFRSI